MLSVLSQGSQSARAEGLVMYRTGKGSSLHCLHPGAEMPSMIGEFKLEPAVKLEL